MFQIMRLIAFCVLSTWLTAAASEEPPAEWIRPPAWAGQFYPAEAAALARTIDDLLAQARHEVPGGGTPAPGVGVVRALVLPHAGIVYSGAVAAHGVQAVAGHPYSRVILLGPDHRVGLRGAVVSRAVAYRTPLGKIPLDGDAARLLERSALFSIADAAERQEHSIEVVLPFLQRVLPRFNLVPLILGPVDPIVIAEALAPLLGETTLVTVSTDLSHFLPAEAAREKDRRTIDAILALDGEALARIPGSACGAVPLQVLIAMARGAGWQPVLLHYANSGDTAGDRDRVVGYAAIAFYGDLPMSASRSESLQTPRLTPSQGRQLLLLARRTIAAALTRESPASNNGVPAAALDDPVFDKACGTFVTLTDGGQLRGCIGNLHASTALREGVRENALNAAFRDPRFHPLKPEDLERVVIEVSVLSVPQPLAHQGGEDLLQRLRPGVDGVILRQGGHSATFLPQVWQQLPRPADFLSQLCRKAGLPGDAWRSGKPEIMTYQVQYFHEAP